MNDDQGTDVVIRCADGVQLVGRVFEPGDGAPVASAVIAPATGVKASYYWRYAAFLAEHGIRAVIADYWGIGRSIPERMTKTRRMRVRWHEWGTLDLDAVLAWTRARPNAPDRLVLVGHSFGGWGACLARSMAETDRLLMVGAQHAHWRDYALTERARMVWRWHIVMPLFTLLCGHFPGKRLGWLENLPRGVAFDWARSRKDFARTIGKDGRALLDRAAQLTLNVLAVTPADDPFATEQATDRTLGYLPQARVERCQINPSDLNVDHIGHFGLFHDRFRETLWPRSVEWLLRDTE